MSIGKRLYNDADRACIVVEKLYIMLWIWFKKLLSIGSLKVTDFNPSNVPWAVNQNIFSVKHFGLLFFNCIAYNIIAKIFRNEQNVAFYNGIS